MDHVQRLKDLAVSETGFVFDPISGSTFNTNGTGRLVLEALRDEQPREDIKARLRREFSVLGEDLDRDLDEFVFLLRESSLLPPDFTL
jgi:hypothetical protein